MSETVANEMVFCRACGQQLHVSALSCTKCGAQQRTQPPASSLVRAPVDPDVSSKLLLPAVLLCFWFGVFGVHRFFVGKVGTGLLMLFTFGGLGIWALIDLIILICGAFTDSDGRKLTQWT
jgi:ribosomal protein L40E